VANCLVWRAAGSEEKVASGAGFWGFLIDALAEQECSVSAAQAFFDLIKLAPDCAEELLAKVV
jgi:hypothetical protein